MGFLNMGKYHNWSEKFCGGTNNTKMQKIKLVNLKSKVTIQIKAKKSEKKSLTHRMLSSTSVYVQFNLQKEKKKSGG